VQKKKIAKQAKRYLPIIGIIILLYLIYSLDIEKIIFAFLSIPPIYIIISGLLSIPVLLLRNIIWQLILKEQKLNIKFIKSLKYLIIGYFYGTVTPGYYGQLVRILYLKEETGQPYGKLFVNSFIDTIIRTFSPFIMMVIGGFIVLSDFPELFYLTFGWITIFSILIIFFFKKERGERFFNLMIKYIAPKNFRGQLNLFLKTFYYDFPRLKKLIVPFLLGIVTWLIIFTQVYLFIIALGLEIPYLYFLLLYPIANSAGFVPITFAGLGVRELTSVLIFSNLFKMDEAEVLVFTLLGFVVADLIICILGFILSLTEARKKEELNLKKNDIMNNLAIFF
jgi:uncharacterized protein (TIRG00374 family)